MRLWEGTQAICQRGTKAGYAIPPHHIFVTTLSPPPPHIVPPCPPPPFVTIRCWPIGVTCFPMGSRQRWRQSVRPASATASCPKRTTTARMAVVGLAVARFRRARKWDRTRFSPCRSPTLCASGWTGTRPSWIPQGMGFVWLLPNHRSGGAVQPYRDRTSRVPRRPIFQAACVRHGVDRLGWRTVFRRVGCCWGHRCVRACVRASGALVRTA